MESFGRRNHVGAYDFFAGRMRDACPIRMLTIVVEYTRACFSIDVKRKLSSECMLTA